MHWKLKENIRLNKICSTCKHGSSIINHKEIELCCKDEEGGECPMILAPKIRTCLEWIEWKKDDEGI